MKRSTPLARRTPLVVRTGLRRTALSASPLSRSTVHRGKAKGKETGPSPAVRRLVALRSDGWCEWPGCWLVAADVHHRLNRKSGGRHGEMRARINQAAWLLHTCRPHHSRVTSPVGADRVLIRLMGWLLHEGEDALTAPVESRHGRVLLLNDGTSTPTERSVR